MLTVETAATWEEAYAERQYPDVNITDESCHRRKEGRKVRASIPKPVASTEFDTELLPA